jgi:hypothetical protein
MCFSPPTTGKFHLLLLHFKAGMYFIKKCALYTYTRTVYRYGVPNLEASDPVYCSDVSTRSCCSMLIFLGKQLQSKLLSAAGDRHYPGPILLPMFCHSCCWWHQQLLLSLASFFLLQFFRHYPPVMLLSKRGCFWTLKAARGLLCRRILAGWLEDFPEEKK